MKIENSRGFVLLLTLLIMASLSAVAGGLIVALTTNFREIAVRTNDAKAFWLSEAGIEKAIWNLKTPPGSGGMGENWTTPGTIENLGGGNYSMVVVVWDFALSTHGATIAATSSGGGTTPQDAIDNNASTYWESNAAPSIAVPQNLTVHFPQQLTINKAKFTAPTTGARPQDYVWQVSSDGINFTTVFTGNNVAFNASGVTDEFSAQSNVNYLRLSVTQDGAGVPNSVRIKALEVNGNKITSTGTVNSLTRKLEQTVVVDDTTQTSYDEIDWNEI